jgi:hypothetical protein
VPALLGADLNPPLRLRVPSDKEREMLPLENPDAKLQMKPVVLERVVGIENFL